MNRKRRIHDTIVGGIITAGVAMIQSGFTGFCPVYYTLDRLGVAEHTPAPSQTA